MCCWRNCFSVPIWKSICSSPCLERQGWGGGGVVSLHWAFGTCLGQVFVQPAGVMDIRIFRDLPQPFPEDHTFDQIIFQGSFSAFKAVSYGGFYFKRSTYTVPTPNLLSPDMFIIACGRLFSPEVLFLACVILDPFLNWKSSPWVQSPDRVPASSLCWLPQRTKIDLKTCLKTCLTFCCLQFRPFTGRAQHRTVILLLLLFK